MNTFQDFYNNSLKNNLVVIFPGRFQPFHPGHKKLYDYAKEQFPAADFRIATSNVNRTTTYEDPKYKIDPERYPFTFEEKKKIIQAYGIHESEIQLTANPYKPVEILKEYKPEFTKVIFIGGKKNESESEGKPRFNYTETSYFQPFKKLEDLQPFDPNHNGHAYIYEPLTLTFRLGEQIIQDASQLRKIYKEADEQTRRNYIRELLGEFNKEIYDLFSSRLG